MKATSQEHHSEKPWVLKLFVAGRTGQSEIALNNLRSIVEEYLPGECHIEVVDIMQNPEVAEAEQVLAIPFLVRQKPAPVRRIVGTFSDVGTVVRALGIPLRPGRDSFLRAPPPVGAEAVRPG